MHTSMFMRATSGLVLGALVIAFMPGSLRASETHEYKEVFKAHLMGSNEVPAVTT